MSYFLYVKPRKGNFLKNYDTVSKMDSFVKVTLGTETQKSDVAQGQGKTPIWKKALSFKLTPIQYNNLEDLSLLFEAFDEDVTSDEFIGRFSVKLARLRLGMGELNSITLYDAKNAVVGTIDVEIEVKGGEPTITNKASLQKTKHVVGTIVVKPGQGKFESASGVTDSQELYIAFTHADTTYHSGVSEGSARRPTFKDIISFQQYEGEDMAVRCFNNDPDRNELIGEGTINISQLAKRGGIQPQTVALYNTARKAIGEVQVDVEFIPEVFNNPVKVYPPVGIRKGEYISKKIKYSNPDKIKKNLRVKSENKDIILVRTESVTILPGESGDIRFKFFAPQNPKYPEETCRIDVMFGDTIEESLLFKLRAI